MARLTDGKGRPVVAVTGVNGKTTTTRCIAHTLMAMGQHVGMTCTEGIYIDRRRIETGDCSGPQSARTVLTNPKVDAAIPVTRPRRMSRATSGFPGPFARRRAQETRSEG